MTDATRHANTMDTSGQHIVGPPLDAAAAVEALEAAEREYARRYQARIVSRLMVPGSTWTQKAAENLARLDWEALMPSEHMSGGFENDPEGAADESMSYWHEDDGDE